MRVDAACLGCVKSYSQSHLCALLRYCIDILSRIIIKKVRQRFFLEVFNKLDAVEVPKNHYEDRWHQTCILRGEELTGQCFSPR